MKKLLLSLSLLLVSATIFAQSVSVGIRGGANLSSLSASSGNYGSQSSITSFTAGVFADLKFGNLSIQPGLFLTGKGGKNNITNFTIVDGAYTKGTEKTSLFYTEIPVDLVYHIPILIGNIYIGAGPYTAFGTFGKVKGNLTYTDPTAPNGVQNETVDHKVTFGNTDDFDFKPTEFGANAIAGVKFKSGFLINLNYDFGLSSISPDNAPNKLKTRVLGLSVGCDF